MTMTPMMLVVLLCASAFTSYAQDVTPQDAPQDAPQDVATRRVQLTLTVGSTDTAKIVSGMPGLIESYEKLFGSKGSCSQVCEETSSNSVWTRAACVACEVASAAKRVVEVLQTTGTKRHVVTMIQDVPENLDDAAVKELLLANAALVATHLKGTLLSVDVVPVDNNSSDDDLSSGAIAGIVIGCVAFVALAAALVYYFFFRSSSTSVSQATNEPAANDSVV